MSSPVTPTDPFAAYAENPPTSLAPGQYVDTIILNKIFDLLANMINVLQNVGTSQANRLTLYTDWQQAYTDAMNQVHSFVRDNGDGSKDNGTAIDDETNTTASNDRQDLNTTNSTYTEELRSDQSTISDDAKSLQSDVNQTNDEVNQQSDMATSIIQELSTILGSIYQ
jgi:hypothetical protein